MLDNINKDLEKIQLLFYRKPNFDNYVDEVVKWLEKNKTSFIDNAYLNKLDKHIQSLLPSPESYEGLIVRAGLIGMLVADNEKVKEPLKIDLNTLPSNIQEAAKKYNLSPQEIEAMKYTQSESGVYIQRDNELVKTRTKEILLKQQSHRQFSTRELRRALEKEFESEEGIKTDFEKLSVYTTNAGFNNSYLARTGAGEWVIGVSRPDACKSCKEHIDGRLFKVIEPPGDYSNLKPGSKEYQRYSEIYDNCLWVGKNNIGRKKTKQISKNGETFTRDHHETYVPALPMHPLCQCRTYRIIPEEQYLDKKGKLQFRVSDTKTWEKWYNEIFKPLEKRINDLL